MNEKTKYIHPKDREIVLLDIVKFMGPEFSKMIFKDARVHELLEYCRPEVDDLPDGDDNQDEYIAHLEAFEANIADACDMPDEYWP